MKAPTVNVAGFTTKRALIDKANSTTVIAAGIAAFLLVFSLVSAKSFVGQIAYQDKIISAKKQTYETIQDNLKARDSIVKSYDAFAGTSQNLLGGNTIGTGDSDGDNAKIILDALPSKYDFPALASSLEKLAANNGLQIEGVTGTDDEVAQSAQKASATPLEVPIVFSVKVNGSYASLKNYLSQLEKSIRPIQIQKYTITSAEGGVSQTIEAQTFYQPEKVLELKKEVMKSNGTTTPQQANTPSPAAAATGTAAAGTGANATATGGAAQ